MPIDYAKMMPLFIQTVEQNMAEIQIAISALKTMNDQFVHLEVVHRYFHSTGSTAALMQQLEISNKSRNAEKICKYLIDSAQVVSYSDLTYFETTTTEILSILHSI